MHQKADIPLHIFLPDNDMPLTEKAAQALREYIITHNLKKDDKLPTENELSKAMGVSRSTVREAIRSLQSHHIVYVRHGAGTFVCGDIGLSDDPLGLSFIKDKQKLTRDLLVMRTIIEPAVAELAAQNATDEDIAELDALYRELEDCIMSGRDYLPVDLQFHRKIAEASGNSMAIKLTPIISEAVHLFTTRTDYLLLQETLDTHKAVLDAIKAHDLMWARDAMLLHMAANRNELRRVEQRELGLGDGRAPRISDEVKRLWGQSVE